MHVALARPVVIKDSVECRSHKVKSHMSVQLVTIGQYLEWPRGRMSLARKKDRNCDSRFCSSKEQLMLRLEGLLVLVERRMRTKLNMLISQVCIANISSSAIYRREFLQGKVGMLTLKQIENFLPKTLF